MLSVLPRASMAALCLIGLLVQSLGGGLNGVVLCIGCERTGWTIAGQLGATGPHGCCDDESEPSGPAQNEMWKLERRCGCVTIPLTHGLQYSVAAPRVEGRCEFVAVVAIPGIAVNHEFPDRRSEIWARAGPTHPPRLLTPSARRTVLVI